MAPYRRDNRAGRHPFQLFTLYLAFITGVPTVLGLTPRPGSINEALHPAVAYGWALFLTVGSLTAIVGVFCRNRGLGLVLEQLGLGLVGLTSLIYVGCAIYVLGVDSAIQPIAIVAAFGASCLWRYGQLQRILNGVRTEQNRRDGQR